MIEKKKSQKRIKKVERMKDRDNERKKFFSCLRNAYYRG